MTLLGPLLYGATTVFKTGLGLLSPWVAPFLKRPMLLVGFGAALIVLPYLFNKAGRQAVVADVANQAKDLHVKDGAENLELVREQAKLVKPVERAEERLDEMKRVTYDTKNAAVEKRDATYKKWAAQPLPDVVLRRLRQR